MPNDQLQSNVPSSLDDDEEDKFFRERMAADDAWLNHDWPEDKIGREIYVVGGGTIDAAASAFSKKNIGITALEAGGSLAIGFAVRAAEAEIPALRPAIAIGGAALTFSCARDLLGKTGELGGIIADTWKHRDHREQDRSMFAENAGKFAIDFALTSAAGLGGSALGDRLLFSPASNFRRIPTFDGPGLRGQKAIPHARLYRRDDPLALLYDQTEASSLRFRGEILKGPGAGPYNGNGYLISEDGLAVTNWHCAANKDVITMTDHLGVTHKGKMIAGDYASDVAIVQLEKGSPGTVFQPLKLAQADAKAGARVYLVGHQSNMTERTLHPGTIKDIHDLVLRPQATPEAVAERKGVTVHPWSRKLLYPKPIEEGATVVHNDYFMANYFSKKGYSGSAVLNQSGEVVGVHFGTFGSKFSQLTSRVSAVSASAISKVFAAALLQRGAG